MKIGIFTDTYTPDINGVVSSVITLQNELEEQGHEVYVITSHKSLLHATREGNVFRMPGLELKWLYGYILSTPYHFSIKAEIEKLNLDVVHVHTEFGVGIFARIVAKVLNIPVVYTYHTMYEDYTHYINRLNLDMMEPTSKKLMIKFSKYMCSSVANIIAPSEKTKQILEGYGIHRPIHIIPTGLNLDLFKPNNIDKARIQRLKEKYNITPEKHVITYLGRIAPEKNITLLIEGFQYVEDEHTILMIVGAGPSEDDLKQKVVDLGIENRVLFIGKVPRDEVPYYYAMSDAFASASTSETQGMTYIEALASGLPVFACHDECVEGLVIEYQTGYFIEDAKQFATQINHFISTNEDKSLVQARCMEVVQKYDVHQFAKNVVEVYRKAVYDFNHAYHIKMIKATNDNMKLYLENSALETEEVLLISIDDYMLYHIEKGGVIEEFMFTILKDKERLLLANMSAIKFLRAKDRTRKEMYDFLINQEEIQLSIKEINDLIDKLEEKGYINDEAYMIVNIDRLNRKAFGKSKILKKLVEKGLPYKMVEQSLMSIHDDEEQLKAEKQAAKYMLTIKNKSLQNKKMTMIQKLVNDGFTSDTAKLVVNKMNYEEDILKETMNVGKAVEKAYKNYSRKYEGKMLRNKIIAYCLNKGFLYDDIQCVLTQKEQEYEIY